MNIEEFREYCLSLPGTVEKLPFRKFKGAENVLIFYVRGKMYCLIDIDVCGTARTVVWEVGKCENRRQMPFMISIYLLPDWFRCG